MLIFSTLAFAEPPICDPEHGARGDGFCLTEAEYIEFGRLRTEVSALHATVAARDAELLAFEEWKRSRDAEFERALGEVEAAGLRGVREMKESCDAARKRTFIERNGVVVGLVIGAVSTVVLTGITMEVYGDILVANVP